MRSTTVEAQLPCITERSELRGKPASGGRVTGTARVLHHPSEGARMRPGDILVCVTTTPVWAPLFSIAGGVVTETGGALSSLATVARERGIPTVISVHGATARIRDGQIVTVDGDSGVVLIDA